jgi:hypothetical protein
VRIVERLPITEGVDGDREPIVYWFQVTSTPAGGAPEEVREAWVGVLLPVRRPRPVEGPEAHVARDVRDRQVKLIKDGVAVAPDDAVKSLRLFGRADAAQWWETYFVQHTSTVALAFRTVEGRLLPPSYALMRFPELVDFGVE